MEVIHTSVHVDVYADGLLDGKWASICLYGHDYENPGCMKPIPVISGQSAVHSAIRWFASWRKSNIESISPALQDVARQFGDPDVLTIDGSWFAGKNFDAPEYCGYFPKQLVASLQVDDDVEIDLTEIIDAADFRELNADEQKAYQYYEYTEPHSAHDIMRQIQRSLKNHIDIHNHSLRVFSLKAREYIPNALDWNTIRAVVFIS